MGTMFRKAQGDWTKFRSLNPPPRELDYHLGKRDGSREYFEVMADVENELIEALKKAQPDGVTWLLITHGWSTSRPGKTVARSVVRGVMRSRTATPYIN